ncbi:hypothetical protein PPL_12428 [Heterostelium album PN500]|uniref:Uncharacterized protein n=1 Tax=Heterostelium pallidum (strain ATCC 26659 / Pp 5 / PN500) TaxID=670386 RepID=D3BMK6_HETP5|nr:hypothetical protein PPL_12428 [Heterostelium album PN500]EFA77218.1 hypothetical protein PPL_12428 [Heterostelium album PN500]|eukprot:XP_020429347.1 hypothetical protein PPL_12428 [Heterostelium album PN500]
MCEILMMGIRHLFSFVDFLEFKQPDGSWIRLSKDIKELVVEKGSMIICNGDSLLTTHIDEKEGRGTNSAFDRVIKAFDERVDALAPYFSEIKFIISGQPTPTKMIGRLNNKQEEEANATTSEEKKEESSAGNTTPPVAQQQQQTSGHQTNHGSEKAKFMLGKVDTIHTYRFRCIEPFLIKRAAERSDVKVHFEQSAVEADEEIIFQSQQLKGSVKYVFGDVDFLFHYDTADNVEHPEDTVVVYYIKRLNRYKWFKRSDLLKLFMGENFKAVSAPLVAAQMMSEFTPEYHLPKQADSETKCQTCGSDAAGYTEFKRGTSHEFRAKDHSFLICPNKYVELANKQLDELNDHQKKAFHFFSLSNYHERMAMLAAGQREAIAKFSLPDTKFSPTPENEFVTKELLDSLVAEKITLRQAALKCTIAEERFQDFAEIGATIIDPRFEKRRKALKKDFDFITCYRYHLYNIWTHLNELGNTKVNIAREDLLNFIFSDSRNTIPSTATQSNNKKDDKKSNAKAANAQSKFKFLSMEDEDDD